MPLDHSIAQTQNSPPPKKIIVDMPTCLADTRIRARRARAQQPSLPKEKQERLNDKLARMQNNISPAAELAEQLATLFFAGNPKLFPQLSPKLTDVFPAAKFDDVFHGHDVIAFFEDAPTKARTEEEEEEEESALYPLYPLAIDVTSGIQEIGDKVHRLVSEDVTAPNHRRRFPPADAKQLIYLPKKHTNAEIAGGVNMDEVSPRGFHVPMVGFIHSFDLVGQIEADQAALEGLRDLFGIQLLVQARFLAAHAIRHLEPAFPVHGHEFSFSSIIDEAARLSRSKISKRDAWLLRAIAAYAVIYHALQETLLQRHPELESWLMHLDTKPKEAIEVEFYTKHVGAEFAGLDLTIMHEQTRRLLQIVQHDIEQTGVPSLSSGHGQVFRANI